MDYERRLSRSLPFAAPTSALRFSVDFIPAAYSEDFGTLNEMTRRREIPITEVHTKIAAGGRIVIPLGFRRELGADVGDEVILRLVGGEIHVLTPAQAIRRAQASVRRSPPSGQSAGGR